MSFGREKRLLLGVLALLAPLPLPLNDLLSWPVCGLFLVAVLLFLRRAYRGADRWLPAWAMNLLGVLYLPVLLLDLGASFSRGQVVQAVVHLCMFAVVVKLFALAKDSHAWQTYGAVFFVFMAAAGTSVHPSVVLYILTFVVLSLVFLARMAMYRVLASFGTADASLVREAPIGGFVGVCLGLAILMAIPLFVIFPRIRDPFIGLRGTGTGTVIQAAGFTDEVSLDAIRGQRDNPEVAMRLQYQDGGPREVEPRFKGGTFELYRDRIWQASRERDTYLTATNEGFLLDRRAASDEVDVWLQPLGSRTLILPVEAVRVQLPIPVLKWDRGGAVSLWRRSGSVLSYRVAVADEPVLTADTPSIEDPTLDLEGVTPRVAELARQVMGDGLAAERVRKLENHLMREYAFSVDFIGRVGSSPIESFLFDYRQGHCEFFASAMVLMLRSEGIPARLVSGFLGAEYNPLTDYYIVRQSNAHAWVEAYLPEVGWQVFDPTPPAGRPASLRREGWGLFRQAYDYLLFRWDRYVLTYGFTDQVGFFWRLRGAWVRLQNWLRERRAERATQVPEAAVAGSTEETVAPAPADAGGESWGGVLLALLVAGIGLWMWRDRRRSGATATAAFQRLRRLLQQAGVTISEATPPLTVQSRAECRFPEAREATGKVIRFYLRESFGEAPLEEAERRQLDEALREARRIVKDQRRSA